MFIRYVVKSVQLSPTLDVIYHFSKIQTVQVADKDTLYYFVCTQLAEIKTQRKPKFVLPVSNNRICYLYLNRNSTLSFYSMNKVQVLVVRSVGSLVLQVRLCKERQGQAPTVYKHMVDTVA